MLKNKKKKGFTLIELIVVIAILGILAAIAIPRLSGMQERSRVRADETTAREILKTARAITTEADLTPTEIAAAAGPIGFPAAAGNWSYAGNLYMTVPAPQQDGGTAFALAYNKDTDVFTVTITGTAVSISE